MTPRELAAAIRKGAQLRPQGVKLFCSNGMTCAIGAAAHGLNPHLTIDVDISNAADKLSNKLFYRTDFDLLKIFDMNDSGLTREQIADWLDTLDVSKPKDAQSFDDFMKVALKAVELGRPVTASVK